VISHDRMFLEELDPTHVVTVRDGRVDCQVIPDTGVRM
jgi:ATPase subunit of ABC transporter with duplicated ATPase domains